MDCLVFDTRLCYPLFTKEDKRGNSEPRSSVSPAKRQASVSAANMLRSKGLGQRVFSLIPFV